MQLELEFAEEWLPVVGFEGWYEVSNLGRVRSLARTVIYKNGRIHQHSGKILRAKIMSNGYLRLELNKEGKAGGHSIHVLVAAAFIGPRPPGLTVDHKDANKLNNGYWNLEYITPKEQIRRARAYGLHGKVDFPNGEKNPAAKLSDVDVVEIRRLYLEGMTQAAIAKQFGVRQSMISRIVNNKNRKHNLEGSE